MKKFIAMLMAAAMMMAMVACGNTSTNNSSNSNNTGDTTGDSDVVTIKIGGIGPVTGDAAVYGVATKLGAQVAVDEINALDSNIKFEYDFQDDTNVAETAVSAYSTLKDWDVDIIYGCTTTQPCITIAGETFADRYFQLTPSASSTDVTAGKDNMFQMCFTDPNQGVTAADYISEHQLGTKIGIIYNNGDAYSTGIAEAFIAHAADIGLEVVATETFPNDKNTDYNVQLNACKDAGADLVFLPIYYTPASLILAQANAMGYAPTFFGADGMDGILAMEGFDASLAEGLMLMTPFNADATDDATVNFVESYKKLSGDVIPNQFAADGYDCIYAIYAALQKIDNLSEIAAMDYAERHEALCDAMISVFTSSDFSVDGLTGSGMTWGTNGEISKDPVVVVIQDGAYVTM